MVGTFGRRDIEAQRSSVPLNCEVGEISGTRDPYGPGARRPEGTASTIAVPHTAIAVNSSNPSKAAGAQRSSVPLNCEAGEISGTRDPYGPGARRTEGTANTIAVPQTAIAVNSPAPAPEHHPAHTTLVDPMAKNTHPARNANPPMGVMGPNAFFPVVDKRYRLPENRMMPRTKHHAAYVIHVEGVAQ